MSSVVISGNTSGTITLDAPAVAGTTTLTLPATSGTMVTDSATQTLTNKTLGAGTVMPAGSVLQVVNATYSTQVDTTSGSYVDTGLSASITPTSSSSKILIIVNHQISISSGTGYGNVQLLRGSTSINVFAINLIAASSTIAVGIGTCYLDSPATTSSTTYKTQIQRTSGGGTFTSQQNSAVATITLLEIAA